MVNRVLQINPIYQKYLLDEWSENEVNIFLERLKKFEELAARFPKLYPLSLTYPELRRAVISKHQSVIYEIDDDVIRIHTILIISSTKLIFLENQHHLATDLRR